MITRYLITVLTFFVVAPAALAEGEDKPDYADREEVHEFVRELADEASFNENELLSVFRHAEYKQSIIDAISRPC